MDNSTAPPTYAIIFGNTGTFLHLTAEQILFDAPNLLSERLASELEANQPGVYHVDRSGSTRRIFEMIKKYLSSEKILPLDESSSGVSYESLLREAKFFKFSRLEKMTRSWQRRSSDMIPVFPLGKGQFVYFKERVSWLDVVDQGATEDGQSLETLVVRKENPFLLLYFERLQLHVTRRAKARTNSSNPRAVEVQLVIHLQQPDFQVTKLINPSQTLTYSHDSAQAARIRYNGLRFQLSEFLSWILKLDHRSSLMSHPHFDKTLRHHMQSRAQDQEIRFELPVPYATGFWKQNRLFICDMHIGVEGIGWDPFLPSGRPQFEPPQGMGVQEELVADEAEEADEGDLETDDFQTPSSGRWER